MRFSPPRFSPYRILPFLIVLLSAALVAAQSSAVHVRKAVFSDRQLFWPQLAGQAKPASKPSPESSLKARPVDHQGAKGKPSPTNGATGSTTSSAAVRIAVLPIRLTDYRESLPCDSCHRISANGMEFFLENYLKDKVHDRFAQYQIDLIAPQQPLLETKLELLGYLDSLEFPWEKWFPDSSEDMIYRPHDRFTNQATRKRMDKLGGMLGVSHLLLPCRMHVAVTPKSSVTHEGGLDWGFSLVFWNVAAGAPEWALRISDQEANMNLDDALDARLDKALGAAWDGLPGELSALWDAEPK